MLNLLCPQLYGGRAVAEFLFVPFITRQKSQAGVLIPGGTIRTFDPAPEVQSADRSTRQALSSMGSRIIRCRSAPSTRHQMLVTAPPTAAADGWPAARRPESSSAGPALPVPMSVDVR